MLTNAIQAVSVLILPAIVILASRKIKFVRIVSTVLTCYVIGMIVGNLGLYPIDTQLSMNICTGMVALAIPLLLFTVDIVGWLRLARATVLSFFFCLVAVTTISFIASYIFADQINDSWKIAGMLVGVYTGGTPNMAAIGTALNVDSEVFMMVNSADVFVCAFYLPFLLTVGGKFWGLFLPPFKKTQKTESEISDDEIKKAEGTKITVKSVAFPMLLALCTVAIGGGLSLLLPQGMQEVVAVLTITSLAIALSLNKKVRALEGSNELGHYFLLVFCVSIGTVADFDKLLTSSMTIVMYVAVVLVGATIIHITLSAIFKLDRDTVIITSTAAIFGPAFVGPVALALKNEEVIVSGIASSLVGYAVGNYLGLGLAWMLSG